jgi:hypothetical protein
MQPIILGAGTIIEHFTERITVFGKIKEHPQIIA